MSSSPSAAACAWLAALLWTALVWSLSSESLSAASTANVLDRLLAWLVGHGVAKLWVDVLNYVARKGAHLSEYAIVGILYARALSRTLRTPPRAVAALAFTIALAVAALDEFHQAHTATRTGAASDVVLDASGAAIGLLGLRWWRRRLSHRARSKQPEREQ